MKSAKKHHAGPSKLYGHDQVYKVGDVVECIVDRHLGTVSFIIKGYDYGVAFKDKEITTGDLYFAVSLQYKAVGFEILKPKA